MTGPDAAGDLVRLMPFADRLGIRLEAADADAARARLAWSPDLCTAGDVMHGGVLMALADSVGAVVTFLGLPAGAGTATITSTTQLFRPVTAGEVVADARLLHRGRTTVTVQTTIRDGDDRLVAQTTQIQAVRPAG
jgi:uncharacterized protein (TIGR00369 family)